MSSEGSDKLPAGEKPRVGDENDKIYFPDEVNTANKDKEKPEPTSMDNRNAIQTGLKDGYDRDAAGNPAAEWK
ncbi:hypothetical protein ILUMI_23806 [Ignelater luminosus]|uniref:Uncharacterized protein n=1 Tax=Ignelater luminosus TaxID=2038154 RepID=A0A8K0CBS3_IGNLU|nr:hypothetical protein ILUMI_23806 [Ignelater luminosus]